MDINQAFGQVLQELRKEHKVSQEKLALECDLDRTFISMLERGLRQPSLTTIYKIADFFGMKMSELVVKTENHLK